MIHGVEPAALHGLVKRRRAFRMGFYLVFSGDENIAVKINPIGKRPDDRRFNALLPHQIRFVGQVGGLGINLAANEIID